MGQPPLAKDLIDPSTVGPQLFWNHNSKLSSVLAKKKASQILFMRGGYVESC